MSFDDDVAYKLKVVMLGDSDSGKTSVLMRYSNNDFSSKCKTTIGENKLKSYMVWSSWLCECRGCICRRRHQASGGTVRRGKCHFRYMVSECLCVGSRIFLDKGRSAAKHRYEVIMKS